MEQFLKESFNELQNKYYADPSLWHFCAHIKLNYRLKCLLRYANILQLYGLLGRDTLKADLKVLEPGCGIGALSSILTFFGETHSFDCSKEAIKEAISLYGDNKAIIFFEGDGTIPDRIPTIVKCKFDFILIKEFYPLTRNIIDNPDPLLVVQKYYDLLNKNGIMIIEHAFRVSDWKKNKEILQTGKIIKKFKALVMNTIGSDIIVYFPVLLRYKVIRIITIALSNFLSVMACYATNSRLSKTIVIKK